MVVGGLLMEIFPGRQPRPAEPRRVRGAKATTISAIILAAGRFGPEWRAQQAARRNYPGRSWC